MVGVAVSAGLLTPRAVLAAWPKGAFDEKNMDAAIEKIHGTASHAASGEIKIKAPDIAENGAVVPITVTAGMSNVEAISVFVKENPSPLACNFNLGAKTEGFVSTRIKMGKTSELLAVVKSGGKLFSASKTVKVTIGGCGG
jgi:sulfur-oxidizing protein SoxY